MKISRFISHNREISAGLIVMIFVSVLLIVAPPVRSAQFVIAEWDHPDEYGQGIEAIELYENSTGSWLLYETYFYDDDTNIDWNASQGIKLRVYTWFNSTLTGAGSSNEGKLYQRHNVTVHDLVLDSTVFFKQNFTYVASDTGIDPPMWYYTYDVVLVFLPTNNAVYTVTVNYDTFYVPIGSKTITPTVTADSDDTNWEDSTNENGRTSDYVAGFITLREYWFRVEIPLPQGTSIFSATAYFYATIVDTGNEEITLQRSTEIGLGSMEADGTKPATTAVDASSGDWPVGTGWFTLNCTDTIRAFLNDGSWTNNSYAGFRLFDSGGSDDGNALEDYQHADSHHTYISITTGNPWNTASNLNMMFTTPLLPEEQQWMFDASLVILGVIMIPTSGLYLAYGVKHDRSSDRLFYGLVIFLLGCGLFIGGIMP